MKLLLAVFLLLAVEAVLSKSVKTKRSLPSSDVEQLEARLVELLKTKSVSKNLYERKKGGGGEGKGKGKDDKSGSVESGESDYDSDYEEMYGYDQDDVIEWYKETCGVDLGEHFNKEGPATPGEVTEVLSDFLPAITTFSDGFAEHSGAIGEIETFLETADWSDPAALEQSSQHHQDLAEGFVGHLTDSAEPLMCALGKSLPLSFRIAVFGLEGFKDDNCFQLSHVLWSHWGPEMTEEDVAAALTDEDLGELAQAMRDTMSCIIGKVANLKGLIETANNDINGEMPESRAFELLQRIDHSLQMLTHEAHGLVFDMVKLGELVQMRAEQSAVKRSFQDENKEVAAAKQKLALLIRNLQQLANRKRK